MLHFNSISIFALILGGSLAASEPRTLDPSENYTSLNESKLLDFRYSFPTEVGSHPKLLSNIEADKSATYSEALEGARGDAEDRAKERVFVFHRHEFWRDWTIAGQTERLLALRSDTHWFGGGAHGNRRSGLLLWDKEKMTELPFESLFGGNTGYWTVMKDDFCKELKAERVRRGSDPIAECDTPKDLVLVPVDTNSDWQFDSIHVIADPYVAGAYAEGTYEIAFPINSALISLLRPEYRSSFEAHPQ